MFKESTQEILTIFKKTNFQSLTLKQLSQSMKNLEEASIDQRIRREPDIFEWTGKPKKIRVKPKIPEVVFFKQVYHCLRCRKQFPEDQLVMTHVSLEINGVDIDNYNNLAAICLNCANIVNDISEITTTPIDIEEIESYNGSKWEYKRVTVKKGEIHQNGSLEPSYYYVFQEDGANLREWKHIAQGDNLNSVLKSTIQNIMNYYGKQGWECIWYLSSIPADKENEFDQIPELFREQTILIFKREP